MGHKACSACNGQEICIDAVHEFDLPHSYVSSASQDWPSGLDDGAYTQHMLRSSSLCRYIVGIPG